MMNIKIIKINFLTYVFILLIIFSGYKEILFPIFCIFFVHEIGHIFFIYLFKVKIQSFEIYPFGGVLKLTKSLNIEIYKDFLIACGGIIFQLIFKIFIFKFIVLNYYNDLFLIVNLLPVIPFDGSKIVYIIFSKFISFYKARIIYYIFSFLTLFIYLNYTLINGYFNLGFFAFSFIYTIKEINDFSYFINLFLLERYMYKYQYKKKKYYKICNLLFLRRMVSGYFYDSCWKNEGEILSKKFDNSSYFW